MSASQSPSLRGSGRFKVAKEWRVMSNSRLNPLHCGAVVASVRTGAELEVPRQVSIPFIAGQWSLPGDRPDGPGGGLVSIPFIAGQWSLHAGGETPRRRCVESQSPSLRGSGRFSRRGRRRRRAGLGLNPLHCGAVVASHPDPEGSG